MKIASDLICVTRMRAAHRFHFIFMVIGVLMGLTCLVNGQDSSFVFDLNGNLASQFAASSNPPVILAHPQPQVVQPGELVSFFVVAKDTRNLSYQWRTNGVDLPGATSDTLLLTNVSALNQGLYSVVLSNSSGSVTSFPAMLWIDTDGDGLADVWEQTYFGNLNSNPTGDSDNDGISNADEFNDGTNPTNSASAQFRLVVWNDGGSVTVSPTKLSYTNGEMVTLTATPVPPEIFHGWTGANISRTNPLTLLMNSNKTVYANFQPKILVWTGPASGDWHNPLNWTPNLVPTEEDEVTLSANGTVTINEPAACSKLTYSGGTLVVSAGLSVSNLTVAGGTFTCNVNLSVPNLTLSSLINGSGTLTVTNAMTWSAGTLGGSGRAIIAPGATLTMNNSANVSLDNRILDNAGTTLWTGGGGMVMANAAYVTNRPGAMFEIRTLPGFGTSGPGTKTFENAGTLRKTTNAGTLSFGTVPLNNYGSLEINAGTLTSSSAINSFGSLTLAPGTTNQFPFGSSISGPVVVPPTALVEWLSTCALNAGAQLNGSGLYRITGGPLTLNTDVTIQNLEMANTINGSGNLKVSNAMTWSAGTLGGGGRAIIVPGVTLTMNHGASIALDGRILENNGTAIWAGGANIILANNAVITNRPGAVFEWRTATTFGTSGAGGRFDNAGTLRKMTSSGTATTGTLPLNNYGSIVVETGTLTIANAFNSSGPLTLAPGTTTRFTGLSSCSGTITNPATSLVEWASNGSLNSGAQLNGSGIYRVTSGPLTLNTDVTIQNLEMANTINGSGNLTVSNSMTWSAGTLGGDVRAIIVPGVTLTMNHGANIALDTRILENNGTILWTGGGGIILAGNAVITNRPGAVFEWRTATGFGTSGGGGRFDNAGTLRKMTSSGTANLGTLALNNYGSIEINTGTLLSSATFNSYGSITLAPGTTNRFSGGGLASGPLTVPAGAAMEWNSGGFALNSGAQLNGSGVFQLNGGGLTLNTDIGVQQFVMATSLNGSGNLTISNSMIWSAGTMGGGGRTLIVPEATLTLNNGGSVGLDGRRLDNAGTILWTGAGPFFLVNTTTLSNHVGALFEIRNASSFGASGPGAKSVENLGTLRKINSSSTTSMGTLALNSYGVLDIQTGVIYANGGFTFGANGLLKCGLGGTTPGTGHGQLQIASSATLTGGLSVNLMPGFTPSNGDAFTVFSAAGPRSGTFSSFTYPSNRVTMTLSNAPTSVILLVTNVFPVPQPVLLTPELVGTDAKLIWTATSNVTYRLEYNPALNSTNWSALAGDVTTLSNTASKLDPITSSNRFYRVRVLP
jgi:hypothetical protein